MASHESSLEEQMSQVDGQLLVTLPHPFQEKVFCMCWKWKIFAICFYDQHAMSNSTIPFPVLTVKYLLTLNPPPSNPKWPFLSIKKYIKGEYLYFCAKTFVYMSVSLGVQNLSIFGQKCSPPPKMNRSGGKYRRTWSIHFLSYTCSPHFLSVLHLFTSVFWNGIVTSKCFFKKDMCRTSVFWKGNVAKKFFLKRKCGELAFF